MKHFFEAVFLALALVLVGLGYNGAAIFAAMFCAIAWIWPTNTSKSVAEIIAEADGKPGDTIHVEYEFVSNKGETFTAKIPRYCTTALSEAEVLTELSEYVSDNTGIPIEAERLHVLKYSIQVATY